jgi:translation initiation factor 1
MSEIDPITGLPKEIVNEVNFSSYSNNIKIYSKEVRNRKTVTLIEGIEKERADFVAKKLKHSLACGGTVKNGIIELQGKHEDKAYKLLKEFGYLS